MLIFVFFLIEFVRLIFINYFSDWHILISLEVVAYVGLTLALAGMKQGP